MENKMGETFLLSHFFPTDQTTCITVYWFTVYMYLPWLGFQRWKWLCSVLICESNKNSEPNDFMIYNMWYLEVVSNASMKCILIFYEFDL